MVAACFCSAGSIPRKLRHLRFLHRGRDASSQVMYRVRTTSLSALLNLLPDFPVLGIVAVVAATLVASRFAIATTSALRGTLNYSNNVQADRADIKVCACRYGGQASRRHRLNNTARIINILSCMRGSCCAAHAAGSPDVPLSLHNANTPDSCAGSKVISEPVP
jgi:hypothetical protein